MCEWKRTVIIILCMISIVAGSMVSGAEKKDGLQGKALTLQQFITQACNNDLAFQEILVDALALAYKKDSELASKDLVLEATNQYNFALQDEGNSGIESSILLSKLFPVVGTEVSATYRTSPKYLGTDNTSTFSLMIAQPIAQNAFGSAYRLQDKILGLEIAISTHQIVEAYEDYLASLIAIYYQWYSDYANMQTAELSYTQNNTLLKNIRGRKRYNIADQSDVDTIHVQVIEKKEDELTLHNTYENTTQLVYQAIGYKGSGSLEPAFSMYRQQLIDFTKEYRVFQENSRTYTMLKLMDEKGTAEVKHSADTLLPSVKLLFGYQKEGEEYRIKNSRENLFAGFSFEFSFWQQQNSALYETTKIDLQKTRLTSAQTKIQLETDLKNIYEEIQLEKRLIRSAEQKIALGQRIVGSETRKYRQARTSLSDLIQVINNLDTYRFEKISHTVKLQTLVIEWLRITDQLVYKNNMVVK